MASKDPYESLPDEPELAFIQLEEYFRSELNESPEEEQDYAQYMIKTVASARSFRLQIFGDWKLATNTMPQFRVFSLDIEAFKVTYRIQHSRRERQLSVALDPATKDQIRHLLDQITKIIDRLEVDTLKKELHTLK